MTASALLLIPFVAGGCGSYAPSAGHSPSSGSSSPLTGTGRASISIHWPAAEATRLIPVKANSIRIRLTTNEGTLAAEKLLTRPQTGGETTANFTDLPLGEIIVSAVAFPATDGTGIAQAQAQTSATIVSGLNNPLALTLATTIDNIEITPAASIPVVSGSPFLKVGTPGSFSAVAKNSSGEIVLTAPTRLQWTSSAPGLAVVDGAGKVIGINPGNVQIAATETESGKSASISVTIDLIPTTNVRYISLDTNDLVSDRLTGTIYASTPSLVATDYNLCVINPYTLSIERPTMVGGGPTKLAISDDGKYVYMGLKTATSVLRYNTEYKMLDRSISLMTGAPAGQFPRYVEDIEVMPGHPETVAIARQEPGSPRHAGVVIFDGIVPRPTTTGYPIGNSIVFGTSPDRLYGYNNEITSFEFTRYKINAQGITVQDSITSAQSGLINGFGHQIEHDSGRIYATTGSVVDAETRTLIGTIAANGPVRPAGDLNRVFFVSRGTVANPSGPVTVRAFDMRTLKEVGKLEIPGELGTPDSLVRWGPTGLAFRIKNSNFGNGFPSRVYFITAVPEP